MKYILLLLCMLLSIGCGSINSARPLEKGQHAVGVTLGGPMVDFAGSYIPLPNAVIEGKSGVSSVQGRATDVSYGLNITGIPFDIIGTQVGVSHLLVEQNGYRPAVAVSDKLFLYGNHISTTTEPSTKGFWVHNQLETILSWSLHGQLLYTGLAYNLDFGNPEPVFSPFAGLEFFHRDSSPGFGLQVEARYFALGMTSDFVSVEWYEPLNSGAFGFMFGVNYRIGGEKK